jgi:F0F1-type ATP synthase membrane subunit c/vacuolar-type H+-ATPase subunit K
MLKKSILLISLTFLLSAGFALPVFGQELGQGVAISIKLSEKAVKDGDIISSTNKGYKRSVVPYDPFLFGIVTPDDPALYLEDEALEGRVPIMTTGIVLVRVSTMNGPIKKGDFVTSSTVAGVGQKATENGTVIGTADEDYTEKDPKKYGQVLITLNPHFAMVSSSITRNIFRAAQQGASAAFQTPLGSLRYMVAGLIVLLSFYFGFRFFGRVSGSGVEAMGRNPLASKLILASVIINTIITIFVMLFGVAIAYFILVL